MSYGMYLAAEGAKAQSLRLDVIANNLANVDTVGFKPESTAFQARFAEAIQLGMVPPNMRGLNDVGGGVKAIETLTNFSAGKLEQTGNAGDLAIVGEGFFQVGDPDGGAPLLTRAGSVAVDALNQLVVAGTNQPVLSAEGSPIVLEEGLPWTVTADGYVEQAGELTPLAVVTPVSLDQLTKSGANQFRAGGEVQPVAPEAREVRQGYLEMSGANSTQQMMQMIETTRAFEANTQMIRHQDQATGNLISRVLGG
ncbi:MAG: flagellar hook basal-body protein [Planctomycetota bacterium]